MLCAHPGCSHLAAGQVEVFDGAWRESARHDGHTPAEREHCSWRPQAAFRRVSSPRGFTQLPCRRLSPFMEGKGKSLILRLWTQGWRARPARLVAKSSGLREVSSEIKSFQRKESSFGSNEKYYYLEIKHLKAPYCCCLVAKSCLTLCIPIECSPPASLSMGFPR